MRKFLLVIVFLLVATVALAAPVTIISLDGQSYLTVEKGQVRGPIAKAVGRSIGTKEFYSGGCRVQTVSFYSDTAGDVVGVYDYSAAKDSGITTVKGDMRDLEFEIGIAANTSSATADLKGAPFDFGIYILASDSTNSIISVVYDY
jgi:hypothetical protein